MLRAVATDGHRLARVEAPLPAGAAGMPGVIVPRKTVSELRKLLEGGSAEVKVELSDTKIRFTCGELILVRSEEHTSELQSLMRISYAVFCLKKKIILHKYNTYSNKNS